MPDERDFQQRNRLSPDEVQRVLQRAVDIDVKAFDSVSIDHVRAAAQEAGISQAALDAAIRELNNASSMATDLHQTSQDKSQTSGPLRMFVVGAIGASTIIVLLFMWLIPGILQQAGH